MNPTLQAGRIKSPPTISGKIDASRNSINGAARFRAGLAVTPSAQVSQAMLGAGRRLPLQINSEAGSL